jgi:hypothetical protein
MNWGGRGRDISIQTTTVGKGVTALKIRTIHRADFYILK